MLHRCGSVYESQLHGRGRLLPRAFGIFFVAGVLGLAALPPLGAFPGKALVEEAAIEVCYGWVAVVFMLATVLTSAALLRAGARVFFGWGPPAQPGTDPRDAPTDDSELVGSRGRVPGRHVRQRRGADRRRSARRRAAGRVRRRPARRPPRSRTGRSTPPPCSDARCPAPEPIEYLHVTPLAVGLSVFTVLATLALCAVLLERPRLPFAIPAAIQRGTDAGVFRLRRLHSGQTRRLRRLGDRRVRRARRTDRRGDMSDLHEI